jgi:hypothetical protein
MKVLNLRCAEEHGFEGWFASEDDFSTQAAHGDVACPLCGNTAISRLPSAPRLNLGHAAAPEPAQTTAVTLQSQWLRAVRQVLGSTEDVGERFAEEARRIHYGEVAERGIRGQASREETEALRDEGIEVMAFALPEALKGPLQ